MNLCSDNSEHKRTV